MIKPGPDCERTGTLHTCCWTTENRLDWSFNSLSRLQNTPIGLNYPEPTLNSPLKSADISAHYRTYVSVYSSGAAAFILSVFRQNLGRN
jgi:hypothetical protein